MSSFYNTISKAGIRDGCSSLNSLRHDANAGVGFGSLFNVSFEKLMKIYTVIAVWASFSSGLQPVGCSLGQPGKSNIEKENDVLEGKKRASAGTRKEQARVG